ncbi:hypothetical protein BC826DRAFT_1104003 [Russula brevipes]|nr:hypothetical protein BC826DRAFT_1104003 [Russula brevipes]
MRTVQAQVLPGVSIRTLRMLDALALGEAPAERERVFCSTARTSLTIAIRLEQGYDSGSVLRTIIAECLHLRHLDFTACRPSFTIVRSHSSPRPAAHARPAHHASLREDDLRTCGTRIMSVSPRLTSFELNTVSDERHNVSSVPVLVSPGRIRTPS